MARTSAAAALDVALADRACASFRCECCTARLRELLADERRAQLGAVVWRAAGLLAALVLAFVAVTLIVAATW